MQPEGTALVSCASCGGESPADFRFCPRCGSALGGAPATPPGEERRLVTTLFCDLVGFTTLSEQSDMEDVDRLLGRYFALARAAIEGHGGVVEKFIGDAVVGVFGVPVAREGDAERAVRAGVAIADGARGLPGLDGPGIRLRVGVNTGEALVHAHIDPGSGEHFLSGDSVNTAARIQSAAPEYGVAVGVGTRDATAGLVEYEELAPAQLKGKAEPVRLFAVRSLITRPGTDASRTHTGPLLGRAAERDCLVAALTASVTDPGLRLVAITGEPGIGKSRLVEELATHVRTALPGAAWRQGRCLPYGDGLTFWPLGEVVKSHAGILDTDGVDVARGKLAGSMHDAEDADWLTDRLAVLVGAAPGQVSREELFAAWRLYLRLIAEDRPLVLTFEDIHWAEPPLLAFIGSLAAEEANARILVLCTARPEAFADVGAPDVQTAASLPWAERIDLEPLDTAAAYALVIGQLGGSVPHELHHPLLERVGGNPLFALELARLIADRGIVTRGDHGVRVEGTVPTDLPISLQALLAARLDGLPAPAKRVMLDASVVGTVFWPGAIAAVGGSARTEVDAALDLLARLALVRRRATSTMAGEPEFEVAHALIRDAAYGQLTRGARAARHAAMGDWLVGLAAEGSEDLAELLAHHFASSAELAASSGQPAEHARDAAIDWLGRAARRAAMVDGDAAVAHWTRAVALAPVSHPARATLMEGYGTAIQTVGRQADAITALDDAVALYLAAGDRAAAARTLLSLTVPLRNIGDARADATQAQAIELLESIPPSPDLARAIGMQAWTELTYGRLAAAIGLANDSLALLEHLGLPPQVGSLAHRGAARLRLGDPGGVADCRDAAQAARDASDMRGLAIILNNTAVEVAAYEGPIAGLAMLDEAFEVSRRRGMRSMLGTLHVNRTWLQLAAGRVEEAAGMRGAMAEDLIPTEVSDHWLELEILELEVVLVTGIVGPRLSAAVEAVAARSHTPATSGPDVFLDAMTMTAAAHLELGSVAAAIEEISALLVLDGLGELTGFPYRAAWLVRIALDLEAPRLASELAERLRPVTPVGLAAASSVRAQLAEVRGDRTGAHAAYGDGAARWRALGFPREDAAASAGYSRTGRPVRSSR